MRAGVWARAAGLAEEAPAGAQGSPQCDCSFAACSGRVAVAGRAPAGAHHDATAYCRAGPVRSRDAGGPLHRPGAADLPPAAAAIRAGDPRVLLPSPRVPVRVLGADAADDRAGSPRTSDHYIAVRGLDLVRFAKGQSKDEVARRYLAGHDGGEQILFVGVAQEKTRVWRTRQRRDPVTGKRYPWLCQEPAMVNHWYFYGFDADFGPFYVKFCGYFPLHRADLPQRARVCQAAVPQGRDRLHRPGQRVRLGQRPGRGAAGLRRADRPEDVPIRRQVAGPAAAPVHPPRTSRRTTAGSCRSSRSSSPPPWRWTGPPPAGSSSSS